MLAGSFAKAMAEKGACLWLHILALILAVMPEDFRPALSMPRTAVRHHHVVLVRCVLQPAIA